MRNVDLINVTIFYFQFNYCYHCKAQNTVLFEVILWLFMYREHLILKPDKYQGSMRSIPLLPPSGIKVT